jgi:hypothetical protein
MKRIIALFFTFYLFAFTLSAQQLPQGYFRNPLGMDIGLSATFAEIRTGHFHAGIDMRTGGAVGQPVYAAADGYVAKVSISPWGGGKILYIKHPNGYTTVYMHLNGYAGPLAKAVLDEHYARRSYTISKLFAPDEFPVKQGQVVAYSGNTGGSGGPHLHFEVRRGGAADLHTHTTTINPLRFGLPYKDSVKPTIRGLRVYPVGGAPVQVGKENSVTVASPCYIGVYATDAAEGSTSKNGPDRVEVYVDGTLFYAYSTEALPVDSIRLSNALIDYPHYATHRQAYLLTRLLPGARGPWVRVPQGDGILRLKPGTSHKVRVRVYDIKNNLAEQSFTLNVATSAAEIQASQASNLHPVQYNQPFIIHHSSFIVDMPAYTLYADDRLSASERGGVVTVEPTLNPISPQLFYKVGIKAVKNHPRTVVVRRDGKRLVAYKTTLTDGYYTASVRDFGTFTLALDTVAPQVKPLNFSEAKPLKGNILKVKITDDLSGVETYNCYLNGSWVLAEFDGKTATLFIDVKGRLRTGSNELRVEVTDGAGNQTCHSQTFKKS